MKQEQWFLCAVWHLQCG